MQARPAVALTASRSVSLSASNALRGTPLVASFKQAERKRADPFIVRAEDEDTGDSEGRRGRGGRGAGRGKGRGKGRGRGRGDAEEKKNAFDERVVQVQRVTKTVKGGKIMSFRATVVIGDGKGNVGVGVSKAREVVNAVSKAVVDAKKPGNLLKVSLTKQNTITAMTQGESGGAVVLLRPASEGTGVIAGGATRVVLELAGVKNCLSKQLGSSNPLNNARATLDALQQLKTFKEVAEMRGLPVEELFK